jgi:hypothetical protein
VATLLSYEAERRMILALQPSAVNTPEARKRRRPLLRFARSDGRLTGMPIFSLIYPSVALAEMVDPLRLGAANGRRTSAEVLVAAEEIVAERLRQLSVPVDPLAGSAEDETWYWAGPILLDLAADRNGTRRWWSRDGLADDWAKDASQESAGDEDEALDDGETRWDDRVEEARSLVEGSLKLGRQPADLARVLAEIALAAPATAALRALTRQTFGAKSEARDGVRLDAARIGRAFLTLFNQPEATGCREVIEKLVEGRKFGFPMERAVFFTVLHRLLTSGLGNRDDTGDRTLLFAGRHGNQGRGASGDA